MAQHVGIVIKKQFLVKRSLVLFDNKIGLVEYPVFHENISLGSLIYYTVEPLLKRTHIASFELVGLPLFLAKQDILFFHHILELCYFFVPFGDENKPVFELLVYLYTDEQLVLHNSFKKIFLMKFFIALGMYPHEQHFSQSQFHELALLSIDKATTHNLDLRIERKLDEWLCSVVSSHPALEKFKTMHFLDESRLP